MFPSIQRPWVDGLEIMTDLMTFLSGDGGKVLAIFAAFSTGAVVLILGGKLACDILDAYREKRIRELNRRTNK